MTDDEVDALLPVVDELIDAVDAGDAGFIEACLTFQGRAPAIAVILAQRLIEAEAIVDELRESVRDARKHYAAALADGDQLRTEVRDLRARVKELRGYMSATARRAR